MSGFTCEDKVIGGYYADIESGCQMFHVCTFGQNGKLYLRVLLRPLEIDRLVHRSKLL